MISLSALLTSLGVMSQQNQNLQQQGANNNNQNNPQQNNAAVGGGGQAAAGNAAAIAANQNPAAEGSMERGRYVSFLLCVFVCCA